MVESRNHRTVVSYGLRGRSTCSPVASRPGPRACVPCEHGPPGPVLDGAGAGHPGVRPREGAFSVSGVPVVPPPWRPGSPDLSHGCRLADTALVVSQGSQAQPLARAPDLTERRPPPAVRAETWLISPIQMVVKSLVSLKARAFLISTAPAAPLLCRPALGPPGSLLTLCC